MSVSAIHQTRKEIKAKTIDQSNNASCIGSRRGMSKRAKRNSHKKLRQLLERDTRGESTSLYVS